MKHPRAMCALTVLVSILIAHGLVFGQAVNGTLLGTVTDATGASAPNTKIGITETNTGISRSATSNESGYFVFPDLPPGKYNVTAELQGFKKSTRTGVDVLVNSTMRVDFTLEPGNVADSITVAAEAAVLQTDRSDTGRQVETKTIEDLPLATNRSFQNLLNLVPGTTRAFRPHSLFFNSEDSLSTQVNGQTRMTNDVMIEGVENQQRTGLLTVYIPPIEAIQTVNVTTSNYDAELGRAGGAATNVVLKSGSNEIHGSLYELNSVSALASRTFFAAKKPVTTYNYYGGTVGGPIRKNKTFFFFDMLRTADRRGQVNRFTLPTNDFRTGDFGLALSNPKAISSSYSSPVAVYDPKSGLADGSGRTVFPGNVIPDNRISSISKKLLALIPSPNLPGYGTNFSQNSTFSRDVKTMDIKIDHNATDSDRIAIRYSDQRPTLTDPAIFGTKAGGPHDNGGGGFQGTGRTVIQTGAVNYNHIFSPTLITEVRFGLMHFRNEARQSDFGSTTSSDLGIKGVNIDPWTSGITYLQIDQGYSNPLVGYVNSLPWIRGETNFDWVNHWTKMLGNHTIKWGGDIRRVRDDLLQTQVFNPRGVFRYNDTITSCNSKGAGACSAGSPSGIVESFAAFLLDMPYLIGRDVDVAFPTYRQTQVFFFGQDTWQVTKKLTLNYGLRWEFYRPATPRAAGGFSQYNPGNNTLEIAGVGNIPMNIGLQAYYRDFAPRFGVAYRMTDKTVVRGGFGTSYSPFPDNRYAYDNFPVKQNITFNNNSNPYLPATLPDGSYAGLGSGFPPPQLATIPSNGLISPAPMQNYTVINQHFKEPYVESWNIAFQRSLPKNFVAELAYVGNHGVRIPYQWNLNAGLIAGAGSAGQPLFAQFGRTQDTNLHFAGGSTSYNALQAKFDKRFSHGFQMTTAYTYGKGMGWVQDTNGLQYFINPRRNYARTQYDRTHTFVQSYIYNLPFGKGQRFLQNGVGAWVAGGWQVTGVLTLMSGQAMNFTYSAGQLRAPGTSNNSPNINGDMKILHGINTSPWFDTSVFSAPAPNTFGNVGRYTASGPGFFNLDTSLFRRFKIRERFTLEFRAEAFSVSNTPQFADPNTELGNSNFGRITNTRAVGDAGSSGGNRSMQLGAKLVF